MNFPIITIYYFNYCIFFNIYLINYIFSEVTLTLHILNILNFIKIKNMQIFLKLKLMYQFSIITIYYFNYCIFFNIYLINYIFSEVTLTLHTVY